MYPFYKPHPERLYKDDIGLFLQHISKGHPVAGQLLSDIATSLSTRYSPLKFSDAEKRQLIESSVARLLHDIAKKDSRLFGETLSEFKEYFDAKYLHIDFYKKCYKENLKALYQALSVKDNAAWELFLEIAHQRVESMQVYQKVADIDEQKEIFQVASEKFMEDVTVSGFSVEKAEHSVASMISFFLMIVRRECYNHFRRVGRLSPLNIDVSDNDETDEVREEPMGEEEMGYKVDFMTDDILTFSTSSNYDAEKEEETIGIIIKSSIKEWTKEALRDCMNRLHTADVELASRMGREIHHWRKLVEDKTVLGKSHQEISEVLNISATNCANRLAKAIQVLKKCMNSKGVYHS